MKFLDGFSALLKHFLGVNIGFIFIDYSGISEDLALILQVIIIVYCLVSFATTIYFTIKNKKLEHENKKLKKEAKESFSFHRDYSNEIK